MSSKKKLVSVSEMELEITFLQYSPNAMDNPMGAYCLFDGRKDRDPELMSEEEGIRFNLFTEKETISFRSITEKQGVTDWFATRKKSAEGSTGTRILGETLTNLDQGNYASELDEPQVRNDDGIEAEVTYDDMIDVNEKIIYFK